MPTSFSLYVNASGVDVDNAAAVEAYQDFVRALDELDDQGGKVTHSGSFSCDPELPAGQSHDSSPEQRAKRHVDPVAPTSPDDGLSEPPQQSA